MATGELIDPADRVILDKYLHDEGYATVEDWALDSDYFCRDGEWYATGLVDTEEDTGPYDLEIQLYWALEAAGYFDE